MRLLILILILGIGSAGCHDDENSEWEAELVHELDTSGTAGGFSAGGTFNSGSKAVPPNLLGSWQSEGCLLVLESEHATIDDANGILPHGIHAVSILGDRITISDALYIIAEATESSLSLIPAGPEGLDCGIPALHLSRNQP
jgi:hypothetical protein